MAIEVIDNQDGYPAEVNLVFDHLQEVINKWLMDDVNPDIVVRALASYAVEVVVKLDGNIHKLYDFMDTIYKRMRSDHEA